MARNIEIKAEVADRVGLEARVAALADGAPVDIYQDDTFFACAKGRLKLRDFCTEPASGELIFYQRADTDGPKPSFYERCETHEPERLRQLLTLAWGQAGRVVKRRRLYLIGRTRVHLDAVEGLGDFMELEVVLADDASLADGEAEAHRLMSALHIDASALRQSAYVDLLAARA